MENTEHSPKYFESITGLLLLVDSLSRLRSDEKAQCNEYLKDILKISETSDDFIGNCSKEETLQNKLNELYRIGLIAGATSDISIGLLQRFRSTETLANYILLHKTGIYISDRIRSLCNKSNLDIKEYLAKQREIPVTIGPHPDIKKANNELIKTTNIGSKYITKQRFTTKPISSKSQLNIEVQYAIKSINEIQELIKNKSKEEAFKELYWTIKKEDPANSQKDEEIKTLFLKIKSIKTPQETAETVYEFILLENGSKLPEHIMDRFMSAENEYFSRNQGATLSPQNRKARRSLIIRKAKSYIIKLVINMLNTVT